VVLTSFAVLCRCIRYYNQRAITEEVYQFALREKYADANLIAKWKKVRSHSLHCATLLCALHASACRHADFMHLK